MIPDLSLRVSLSRVQVAPVLPPLWRVKHDIEMDDLWRKNLPEVHPLMPNHHSPFTEAGQRLSRAMNPKISDSKWGAVYGYKLWITNNQGFGNDEDPRANYITGTNLTYELPRVEALVTGGTLLTGYEEGSNLVVTTLDWRELPEDPADIPQWLRVPAVTVDGLGTPRRFPQGLQPDGSIVTIWHPMIADPARGKLTIPLAKLQRWTAAEMPDPFRLYL